MWLQPLRCSCMPYICFSAAAAINCFSVHHQIVIKGNVPMSNPSCHVRMPCCDSGTSSDSDDGLFIFSTAAQRAANVRDAVTNEFSQPLRRLPKVNRATDERTGWSRTGWLGHVDAKLRENSWNTYYHMHVAAFDELHSLLYTESEAQQITARRKALNSTPMGAIETEVKLACTLRQLFGEESKSLVDVFKISPTSERAAFMDVVARINACPELDGDLFATDHSIPVLERRAQDFADRSAYPTVFRHAIGAIDGLFIKTEQPEAAEVGNVRAYWSGHKKGFGLNMQGVCDAKCRFIGFACNTPGSTNDYVAFRHANFYGHWPLVEEPFYYLGDCAYPLSPFCITPHIGTCLSIEDDAFNFYHSQLRITVERTFGIFVNVFGIFRQNLRFRIATCCDVVEACVRLHNYRITHGCQHVTRHASSAAIYRQHTDRSTDVFDVLDDERYMPDRPHRTDAAYSQYVSSTEQWSGFNGSDAVRGHAKRDALTLALSSLGAQRPSANARQ